MNKTRFIRLIFAVFLKGEDVMKTKFLSLLMTLSVLFLVTFSIVSCNLNNSQQGGNTNDIDSNGAGGNTNNIDSNEANFRLTIVDPSADSSDSQYSIVVSEFVVQSLSIVISGPTNQYFEWFPGDNNIIELNLQAGQYVITVIHHGENSSGTVDFEESADFFIEPMVITRIEVIPGNVGMIVFDPQASILKDKIVFQYSDGLATINSDGTRFLQLPTNGSQPSWFKDKSKIVFISHTAATGNQIFTMNPWGGQITQITSDTGYPIGGKSYPSTSWDDSKILFTAGGPRDLGDIFIMDADGTNMVNLTADLASGDSQEYSASISPDNQKIAFSTTANYVSVDIYLMDIDGSNKINITNSAATDEFIFTNAWLNNGSRIVYMSQDHSNSETHICTMNPDGTNIVQLTSTSSGPNDNWSPSWSYDGTTILFSSFRHGSSWQDNEVYRMNIDGSGQTRITFIGSGSYATLPNM